jgi:hypothetical protein
LGGEIQLFEIQQQKRIKLLQTFPQENSSSSHSITSIIQLNPSTLISCSASHSVIVIWAKSKSTTLYEPIQRITGNEARGGFYRLVVINTTNEEEFASCSFDDDKTIIIWRRGKEEGEFKIRQKITNVENVSELLYISLSNELISASFDSPLLQIWSPSSSSSDFKQRQKIKTSSYICSLCQINVNRNDDSRSRIEFASGHENGQICIWSKQINESMYSSIRTLKPFDHYINDLIFINDNGFDFLVSCCYGENKIVIYNEGEEEEEKLGHERVSRLIPMSNGLFASGGQNQCLNIWSPSSSSSSLSSS